MALSQIEISKINSRGTAIKGRKYTSLNGKTYIGESNGRLRRTETVKDTSKNIEDTKTLFSKGSVIFSDGKNLSESNDELYWDDENKRLSLGNSLNEMNTSEFGDNLGSGISSHIDSLGNNSGEITILRYSDDKNVMPVYMAMKAKGKIGFPEDVEDGERVLGIIGLGYYNNLYNTAAKIQMQVDGAPSTVTATSKPYTPGRIIFETTPADDSTHIPQERLRIDSSGNVGIGETAPQDTLEVNGTVMIKDKLKFTQDDGNEYIDSLADGYMDYGATTGHRFNSQLIISQTGADNHIELGQTAASQNAYIDLKGDTTYTDYGLRLIRGNGGANAVSTLAHRGTGNLRFQTAEAAQIIFDTTNITRMSIASDGAVDVIGDFTAGTIQADDGFTGSWVNTAGATVTVVGGIITSVA